MSQKAKVLEKFHSKFVSETEIPTGLESEWLNSAIAYFETDLYELSYDDESEEFQQDLSRPEVELLGSLMYRQYIFRERDKYKAMHGMVGKDIRLTSVGDTKNVLDRMVKEVNSEIENFYHKLKDNTYYG